MVRKWDASPSGGHNNGDFCLASFGSLYGNTIPHSGHAGGRAAG